MKKPQMVPEFKKRKRVTRAGFIPGHFSDDEVELWTLWCHGSTEEQESRRATTADMRAAGYKRRKR